MSEDAPSARVPFVGLDREYDEVAAELEPAVIEVLRSQAYALGPAVERFEREAAEYLGVANAIGVSNGSDALVLGLAALDVGPGDQVVTTPFTFYATVSAIVQLGAEPVFADISPEDYLLSADAAAAVVTDRTRALLPVQLYGQCVDPAAFDGIARSRRIPILEDAAQAIGAERGGLRAGSLGDVGSFSFYPTKNLAACGEAGMLVTNDDRLAARLRRLRNQGSDRRYEHLELGWNARMDGIQAAALSVKLRHLDGWAEARRDNARRYGEWLRQAGLDATLGLPTIADGGTHVFHQYVVRAPRRDELRAHLGERGIGSDVFYPTPLHLQPCFESLGYRVGDLPEAERAAAEVLALPVFPQLRRDEQERVVAEIAAFYGG